MLAPSMCITWAHITHMAAKSRVAQLSTSDLQGRAYRPYCRHEAGICQRLEVRLHLLIGDGRRQASAQSQHR